ncbi:MAG TPA: AzlC family ABC transporter permease [Acidimicrobiales bacterium]
MATLTHDSQQHTDANGRAGAHRHAAMAGVRAIGPLVAALAPLALTVGATATRTDIPILAAWASSAMLYGASGQLTWMDVLDGGGPPALVVLAVVIVNLQMLLYGAAMRTYWASEPRKWRVTAAQLLVSPVFAVATSHHPTEPDPVLRRRFYMAAALTMWLAWIALTGVGAALGGLPATPALALLTPLVMLSLAVRGVVDSATAAALLVAGSAAVAGVRLPFDLGSVGAGLAGVALGIALDARGRRKRGTEQEAAA